MFRNLAVTAVTGVLVACGYAIACNGPLAAQPAVVNTSGIELAPAMAEAVVPTGVAAAVGDALQTVAQVITGQKKASSAGAGAVKPEEVCEDCCSGCSCDGCDCSCCSCCSCDGGGGGGNGCSGGGDSGGGCGGASCVRDDSPETPVTVCGASDSYELGYDDSQGWHDTGHQYLEATACSPAANEAEACMPPLLYTVTPTNTGSCSSLQTTFHPPKPDGVFVPATGSMQWTGDRAQFWGQAGMCEGGQCEYDLFSDVAIAPISYPAPYVCY